MLRLPCHSSALPAFVIGVAWMVGIGCSGSRNTQPGSGGSTTAAGTGGSSGGSGHEIGPLDAAVGSDVSYFDSSRVDGSGFLDGSPTSGGAGTMDGSKGPPREFTHPGIPLTIADLNQLKLHLGVEPWKSAYAALTNDSHSQLAYSMQGPFPLVSRTPDINLAQYRNDMQAVFNLARMWFFTGDEAYAIKARSIMIAWATQHTSWGGAESYLTMGDYAYRMYGGADILRGTWPGWTQANTDTCKSYFEKLYWPEATVPNPLRSANQGVEQLITGVGVAVFNDDPEKFDQALQAFRADAVGGLANSLPSGAFGDSGRDQGHAYGQLMHLAWIAEVFWKQGVDVYSELDDRLLAAGEFFSRYNLGIDTPFMQFGSEYDIYPTHGNAPNSSPQPPDFLNLIHGAYSVRKGLGAPYVVQYRALRPETSDSFVFRKSEDASSAGRPAPLRASPRPAPVTRLNSADIGGAMPSGSSSYANGIWSIQGAGADIGGASDSFHFSYLPMNGDGAVLARVASVENTAGDAKAGLLVRETLAPDSPMMGVYLLPQTTINANTGPRVFVNMRGQVASSHGAATQTHRLWDATTVTIPYWLKLERIGNRVTAYHSTDGASWSTIHCADFAMGTTGYVGLAVASRTNGTLNTSTFTHVQVTGGDGAEAVDKPAAPFAIYASPEATEVNLRWLESFGATSYRLKRAVASAGPYTAIATLPGTSYVDRGLSAGASYYYVVSAANSAGESADSAEAAAVPPAP